MNEPIRVLCVDDNPDLLEVLCLTIDRADGMTTVGCLERADSLVTEASRLNADIAVVDLSMPGKRPLDAVREVAAAVPKTRVIVYSGYDDNETCDGAFEAGAWAVVSKSQPINEMISTIREVAGAT